MGTEPVACTLTPDQQRCQSAELLPGLSTRADASEWTSMGIRFSFPPESAMLEEIIRVIDRERRCCTFLTFRLEVPEAGGKFLLDLSGPPGTREFLANLLPSSCDLEG